MVAVLNPGDKLGLPNPTDPNLVLGIEGGVKAWTSQRFRPDIGYAFSIDFGAISTAVSVSYASSGTGSGKTISVGDTSTHPMGWGNLNKGTTTTGRTSATHSSASSAIKLSSTSGTWTFECLTMIPTISDATDTFRCFWGFGDTINAEDVDGIYFLLDGPTTTTLTCKTSSNTTRTSVDSGITVVAGTWYRLKIVVTNDTQAEFYIATEGGAFSLVATITTNIPSGSGRETGWGSKILGSAGTNSGRVLSYAWQYVTLDPGTTASNPPVSRIFSGTLNRGDGVGIPNGPEGYKLGVNESGKLAWVPRQFATPTQLLDWFALERGSSREFITEVSGTGAAVTISPDSGYPFASQVSTGSTSTGRGARTMVSASFPVTLVFAASSGTFVFESLFKVVTLSDGTNTHTLRIGFLDSPSAAPSNGAYLEINSNADPQAQCITNANGTSTATDSGVTIAADTYYFLRIVVTNNSQVQFYLGAHGSALALVATNTTNIPSGTGQAVAIGTTLLKSAGTTAAQSKWHYIMGYHLKAV